MEETLGKRIAARRKGLGLTQDALAERLGVTAQAVSKWENDLSCPDITMLPRLAEIFGITVDALLGLAVREPETVHEAEVVTESEPEANTGNKWEFHYDAGRKTHIWFAAWVLLIGCLMLARTYFELNVTLWGLVWPATLLLFGLHGLYPKLSFFRLGCALAGGYVLLENLGITSLGLDKSMAIPIIIILFGLSLLVDAFRKPDGSSYFIIRDGKKLSRHVTSFSVTNDSFDCELAFGSDTRRIELAQLRRGSAEIGFGELTVDLSGCQTVSADCRLDADCAFGKLCLLIPRRYRAEVDSDTAFANITVSGQPDDVPAGIIRLDADASFGEIRINYI